MDNTTLEMLVDEVMEAAAWYGKSDLNRTAETVALGRVSGIHDLDRDQTAALLTGLNARLRKIEQEQHMTHLIQSTIRNVN